MQAFRDVVVSTQDARAGPKQVLRVGYCGGSVHDRVHDWGQSTVRTVRTVVRIRVRVRVRVRTRARVWGVWRWKRRPEASRRGGRVQLCSDALRSCHVMTMCACVCTTVTFCTTKTIVDSWCDGITRQDTRSACVHERSLAACKQQRRSGS